MEGDPDAILTTRNGMRIVVRAVLFCADVAERPGAKGDHKERPFVDVVAVGSGGMSLEISRITRDCIYNGLGHGRRDPRSPARNGRPQTNTQPARAKFSMPFALLRTRGSREDHNL